MRQSGSSVPRTGGPRPVPQAAPAAADRQIDPLRFEIDAAVLDQGYVQLGAVVTDVPGKDCLLNDPNEP
ncbi:hypothetical protein [Microvirga sp. TS319]|uniref:hypothetical protein n=1 Tax=Microvirga sp. TS319 TaxID=3241165 RepID=UPI00351A9436